MAEELDELKAIHWKLVVDLQNALSVGGVAGWLTIIDIVEAEVSRLQKSSDDRQLLLPY